LILAEKEVTAVLNLQRQVAARSGLPELTSDAEIAQLSQTTSIDQVAETIRESLPSESSPGRAGNRNCNIGPVRWAQADSVCPASSASK
jgi:hypothetical protein